MEQFKKQLSAERGATESETLKDEQLSKIAGGQSSSDGVNSDRLIDIENRTVAHIDNSTGSGEVSSEVPLNAG